MTSRLREAVDEFAAEFFWLANPEEAKNRCIDMCVHFLTLYGVSKPDMHKFMESNVGRVYWETVPEHHWLYIEGYHIDFTARQMDPSADFPKIWRE